MCCVKCFMLLCLTFMSSKIAICVRITRLEVPEVVHLGDPVVLDCDYTVEGDEGLVVKWYFNNTSTLIYQWIPNTKPLTLGILRGRVNLEYSASSDTNSVHRALHITKPGPDLSGDYTCAVSSFSSEDKKTKRMLVVAPGKSLELKQEFREKGVMKIVCSAEGVYPQPNMNIHVNNSEVNNSVLSIQKRAGLFDIEVMADIPSLTSPEEFSCELHIPQANYTIRKEAVFYPFSANSCFLPNNHFILTIFLFLCSIWY
ncbi:hypothetical protein HHI36_009275 [Cryptolaemus montrouzieri]|uniref:Ig-like domain-containing protein n=1 Tax=Cryptolaemus montrouzieri TaxID=559131 RepID=A0ABD2MUY6_9CUCU